MSEDEDFMRLAPQKRNRRTRADMKAIKEALYSVLSKENPMTVRQVFYQMVGLKVIGKTEREYKSTVCRLLSEMRRSGDIPYGWLADSTRWMRKPRTFSGLESALRITAQTYRKSYWDSQDVYVEIWLEKDALAGVLIEETDPWQVPLLVTRGYPSLTYLYEAADYIRNLEKPVYLYYFGDHDPSGVDIPRRVEMDIREFAPEVEIHFQRMAVTEEQIRKWKLPTRPTKRTDTRSRNFGNESVEVDAIPAKRLRKIVRECITQNLNKEQLQKILDTEEQERETLCRVAATFRGSSPTTPQKGGS